jgi:hypothetical protein
VHFFVTSPAAAEQDGNPHRRVVAVLASFPSGAVSRPAALPLSCVLIVFGFWIGITRVVVLRASGEQGAPERREVGF